MKENIKHEEIWIAQSDMELLLIPLLFIRQYVYHDATRIVQYPVCHTKTLILVALKFDYGPSILSFPPRKEVYWEVDESDGHKLERRMPFFVHIVCVFLWYTPNIDSEEMFQIFFYSFPLFKLYLFSSWSFSTTKLERTTTRNACRARLV